MAFLTVIGVVCGFLGRKEGGMDERKPEGLLTTWSMRWELSMLVVEI